MKKAVNEDSAFRSEADLDDIFGPAPSSSLRIVRPNESSAPQFRDVGEEVLPDADTMNEQQTTAAVYRVFEDTSTYPRMPWPEVDEITGLLCPEDLWIVAGRTGNGKSLFLLNLFDQLVEKGRTILYVGLEQSPKVLRIKWACLRCGVAPKRILAATPEEKATTAYEAARDSVCKEINWQSDPAIKLRAHFAATRFVTRQKLAEWTDWAVDMGCDMVIVDHVDRMSHGDGRNSFHELSETIRLAKELAVEHRIVMMLASQVGRPGDPLQKFMPPAISDLRGAGTKEEEADSVLTIYRPLKSGVTEAEMKKVRQGLAEEQSIYQPDTMAVRVLKHRIDGAMAMGPHALLDVRLGRLYGRPTRSYGKYEV